MFTSAEFPVKFQFAELAPESRPNFCSTHAVLLYFVFHFTNTVLLLQLWS